MGVAELGVSSASGVSKTPWTEKSIAKRSIDMGWIGMVQWDKIVRKFGWAVLGICIMLYGVLALLLYAQWGSDKYKPESMVRMRINEAELDDIEFQVKTIEMIAEAFCITTLCQEWG